MGQTCGECGDWSEVVYNADATVPLFCPHCGEYSSVEDWDWDEDDEDVEDDEEGYVDEEGELAGG